jgi:hypothetical protein
MTLLNILAIFSGTAFLFYGISCLVTPYMKAEFDRYGLADHRILTGILEIAAAVGLFAGLFIPAAGIIASGGLSLLMLLGFLVRLKIRDGLIRSFPALFFMLVNLCTLYGFLNLN